MLETILIAVVGTTIGIVVHSLNANVAHRQPFLTDKADFYFDEMYSRYAAKKNPKDFTAEDESIIWEYASNHIAMFLTWVIDNGFYGNIHYEASDDIQLVKARKMTGTEFLAKHCDYRLSDEDFSPEILPFVECYYFQKYIQQYDKLFSKKAMALLSSGSNTRKIRGFYKILNSNDLCLRGSFPHCKKHHFGLRNGPFQGMK